MEILASRVLIRPVDYAKSVAFYRDAIGLAIAREYGAGTVFYAGQSLIELAGHGRRTGRRGCRCHLRCRRRRTGRRTVATVRGQCESDDRARGDENHRDDRNP